MAHKASTLGTAAGDADALSYFGAHLLGIRWVQGRLGEMLDSITSVIESSTLRGLDRIYPAALAYASALAGDRRAARETVDAILLDGIDAIPMFSTWSGTIAILLETARELEDDVLVSELLDRFIKVSNLPVMPSLAVVCLGPGQHVVGRSVRPGWVDSTRQWTGCERHSGQTVGSATDPSKQSFAVNWQRC